MNYSVSIEEREFNRKNTVSSKTAVIEFYDNEGAVVDIQEFAYIEMKTIEDMINNNRYVNLDYCYISNFTLQNCIQNKTGYVYIKRFTALYAFFDDGVDFCKAEFEHGYVEFALSKFGNGNVYFCETTFGNGNLDFSGVQFGDGIISFLSTKFGTGNVFFNKVQFGTGDFEFSDVHLGNGIIDFSGSQFGDGDLDFSNSQFGNGDVLFSDVSIGNGTVSFSNAKFNNGEIDFSNVCFGAGDVDFSTVNFGTGFVKFPNVKFGDGSINFTGSYFRGKVIVFTGTNFGNGPVRFAYANFNGNVDFSFAKFEDGDIDFSYVNFGGDIYFTEATFGQGTINFLRVNFGNGQLGFDNAVVDKVFLIGQFHGRVDMCFHSCNLLKFDSCVIHNLLNLAADHEVSINEIQFINCINFGQIQIDWIRNNVKKMIRNQGTTDYYSKAEQFRLLKENFHTMGKYEYEDLAYVQFKRCETWSKWRGENQRNIVNKLCAKTSSILQFIADFIGAYGTSPVRIFACLILNIFIFGLVFYRFGVGTEKLGYGLSAALYYSAITSFTVGYGDISPPS